MDIFAARVDGEFRLVNGRLERIEGRLDGVEHRLTVSNTASTVWNAD